MGMKERRQKAMDVMFKPWLKVLGETEGLKYVMDHLNSLSDQKFNDLMLKVKDGEYIIPFFADNMSDNEATMDQLLDICEESNIEIMHRIQEYDEVTGETYLTPIKYPVGYLPVRRLIQHQTKSLATAEHNSTIDTSTGQVAGDSKVSRLSTPEINMLRSKGHINTILEAIKVRGGDIEAQNEMLRQIDETGEFSIEKIKELNSKPQSTKTVAAINFARHLDNNIIDKI